jgi:hypothetical protein
MHVRIRTNELGVFQGVINWKDVQKYIIKGTKWLKKETKDFPIKIVNSIETKATKAEGQTNIEETIIEIQ